MGRGQLWNSQIERCGASQDGYTQYHDTGGKDRAVGLFILLALLGRVDDFFCMQGDQDKGTGKRKATEIQHEKATSGFRGTEQHQDQDDDYGKIDFPLPAQDKVLGELD